MRGRLNSMQLPQQQQQQQQQQRFHVGSGSRDTLVVSRQKRPSVGSHSVIGDRSGNRIFDLGGDSGGGTGRDGNTGIPSSNGQIIYAGHASSVAKTDMSMHDFDQYQLAAIQSDIHLPLVITAGPGSGKTRTVIGRIVHMMQNCAVPGHKILALTFSKEAAQEMHRRLTSLAPGLPAVRSVTVKTFHAFCLRVLHSHSESLQEESGLRKGFTLCAKRDMKKFAKDAIEEWNLSKDREQAVAQFGCGGGGVRLHSCRDKRSATKIDPKDADRVIKWIQKQKALGHQPSHFDQGSAYGWLFAEYERRLRQENLIDFSDMINKTIDLLKQRSDIADHYAARYNYILVDEFQDLSPIQFEVLRLISHQHGNVTICGDDDQSIYGFRGGSSHLFHSFRKLFPNCVELNLEMNYRSSQRIVDSSLAVIVQNPNRFAKKQISANGVGAPLRLVPTSGEQEEVQWVVREVSNMISQGIPLHEIAILCRVRRNILKPFEQELAKQNIPFVKVLKKSLSDRVIVDDILSYLSLAVDPYDNVSFLKVYNKPKRRLGEAVLNYLEAIHRDKGGGQLSYLKSIELARMRSFRPAARGEKVNKGQQKALKEFFDIIKGLYDRSGYESVQSIVCELLDKIDIRSAIDKERNQASRARDAARYAALFDKERQKRSNRTLLYDMGNDDDDEDGDDDDDDEFERDFEIDENLAMLKEEANYFARRWLLEEQGIDSSTVQDTQIWESMPCVSKNPNTNRRIMAEFVSYMKTNDLVQLGRSDGGTRNNDNNNSNSGQNAVTVGTIHQAKGLEWRNVVLVRCNERILPVRIYGSEYASSEHRKGSETGQILPDTASASLEEERRLMYVGMTRAKESLIISYVVDADRAIPSRFIESIPQQHIEFIQSSRNRCTKVQANKTTHCVRSRTSPLINSTSQGAVHPRARKPSPTHTTTSMLGISVARTAATCNRHFNRPALNSMQQQQQQQEQEQQQSNLPTFTSNKLVKPDERKKLCSPLSLTLSNDLSPSGSQQQQQRVTCGHGRPREATEEIEHCDDQDELRDFFRDIDSHLSGPHSQTNPKRRKTFATVEFGE